MEADAPSDTTARPSCRQAVVLALVVVVAVLAATIGTADAQRDRQPVGPDQTEQDMLRPDVRSDRPVPEIETLRLACGLDFINGQRGVLCRWSEAVNPNTRGYQLYRIVNGSARELVTTVGADGRRAYFDTDITAPSSLVYGVISLNRAGRLIGQSAPQFVQYGQDVQQLRLACAPDSIEGHRGVLCRWSETTQADARGYLLYRAVGDNAREVLARIPLEGREAFFDRNIVLGALHTYAVAAVDAQGHVVAQGGPQHVRWPSAD